MFLRPRDSFFHPFYTLGRFIISFFTKICLSENVINMTFNSLESK